MNNAIFNIEMILNTLEPYLPYMVTSFLFMALSVIGVLSYLILNSLKNKSSSPPPKCQPEATEKDLILGNGKLTEFFSLFGYLPITPLGQSFVRAVQVLRKNLGGPHYKYKLPWFLVIGPENSGKSTFIQNANLTLPLGKPVFLKEGLISPCSWSFFDHAVVLDMRGSYLIEEKENISNNQEWSHFFRLLSHFRVRRPIDGLILTIPASELTEDSQFDTNTILERANTLFQKLTVIEKKLGLNVPVYIVVTKCDIIQGFKSFTSLLSPLQKSQMFGWSSPYDPLEDFQGEWVNEAFESIEEALTLNQLEIFTQNIEVACKDGLILFPQNFRTLQKKLQLYLTTIFKNVGYREAFFCRGIYFTGDTAWQPGDVEGEIPLVRSDGEQPLAAYDMENDRKIAFVTQLLEDKIFPEHILATPGKRRLIASSRAINITRFSMVITFFVLSFGLWKNYHTIQNTSATLNPILYEILTDLQEKKDLSMNLQQEEKIAFFRKRTKTLLLLMSQLEHTKFFFWTLPPSWTGNLYKKVEAALSRSNEEIFLQSIYLELLNKANILIKDPVASFKNSAEFSDNTIDPLQTSEFYNLNEYVSGLHELKKYIDLYNNLPFNPKAEHLGEIVFYLFGFKLSDSIYGQGKMFSLSLSAIKENPISLEPLKIDAQTKLISLFKAFLFAIFEKNLDHYHLISLSETLNSFEKPTTGHLPRKEDLGVILKEINTVISFLDSSNLEWLNFVSFDPGDSYNKLIGRIYESSLFTAEIGDQLVLEATSNFKKFKETIIKIGSNLTGPFFEIQDGNLVAGPSLGLLRAQQSFSEFLSMPFMKNIDQLEFKSEILPETHLYWDGQMIDQALDTVNEFNIFLRENCPLYPLGLQETFRLVATRSAQIKITSQLAQAQNFVDMSNFLRNYAVEESLRKQIENIKPNISTFITLLNSLKEADLDQIYLDFRNLLSVQLIQILSDIDQVLDSEGLYDPINTSFTEWMGEPNAAFLSYNVQNETSLKAYLDLVRERISYLAINFAAPVLNFLNFDEFHLMSQNINLLTRWTLIFDAVTAYNNKKPGNSIFMLQNFILKDMNTITLANYAQKLDPLVAPEHQDFFTERFQELRSDMLARCESLSGKIALNHYEQIQTFFNNRLAGKFPFVGNSLQNASGYAEPQDIKAFFSLYDSLVTSAKEFLNTSKSYGISRDRALEFMMAMDDVRVFFDPFLTSKNPAGLPMYDFEVAFRVNRSREVGANQLLDWVIQVGSVDIDLHNATFSGTWTYGSPVSVSFQWASDGPNEPMTDANQPHLSVNGTTATYTYNSPWALLELLLTQESPLTEFPNLIDPNPQTLFFKIPTRGTFTPNNPSSIPSKLFLRLTPKAPEKQGGKILFVPYFPDSAPTLTH